MSDGPRRPDDDDDWEAHLPDDWEPIPDPRPVWVFRVTAVVVAVALLITAAPLAFRLVFSRPPQQGDTGTVVGRVMAEPQCPVLIAGSPCPAEPIATEVEVARDGRVVAVGRTDEDGWFEVVLPPDTYTFTAGSTSTPYPRGIPADVTVEAGRLIEIELTVDTGIR